MRPRPFLSFCVTLAVCAVLISADASPSCAAWDAQGDATRLLREAPSLAAFPGARGMVWLSSYNYSLRMDGLMEKRHRLLTPIETGQGRTFTIPRPSLATRPTP